MSEKNASIHSFLRQYRKPLYYTIPILAILILACASNFFYIDKKVVNQRSLWDMSGRPYETFLYELNLPNSVGAVFVAGTPDNLGKTEKYYKKVNVGDIFTSQLRSLFGKKITAFSISAYINFIFGISAVIFYPCRVFHIQEWLYFHTYISYDRNIQELFSRINLRTSFKACVCCL